MAMIVGSVAGSSPSGWTGLAGEIKREMWSRLEQPGTVHEDFDDVSIGLATALITYFKANMDVIGVATAVNTTVAVASVSGVTTGPGVSGPGAGTGSGTGTQTGVGGVQ